MFKREQGGHEVVSSGHMTVGLFTNKLRRVSTSFDVTELLFELSGFIFKLEAH